MPWTASTRSASPNVDPGEYLLVAGTDSDGDEFICDPGEACGAFPTTETIVPITVSSDRGGLSFVTGFEGDVGTAAASAGAARGGAATRAGSGPDRASSRSPTVRGNRPGWIPAT